MFYFKLNPEIANELKRIGNERKKLTGIKYSLRI